MEERKSYEEVLKTEYSDRFDKLRQDAMVMSYYKYGALDLNYGSTHENPVSALKSLKKRLDLYESTHRLEYLVDIANFAMIEFMKPEFKDSFYEGTDSCSSPSIIGKNGSKWRP